MSVIYGILEEVQMEKLADELELLSAEATIRGMDQNDFIELCRKAFQGMEVAYS